MASTMTVNAHCARVRVNKKTLLSALFRESGVGTGGAFNQFWSERELRDLTTGMCGLEGFERRRSRQFIFFRVNKPAAR